MFFEKGDLSSTVPGAGFFFIFYFLHWHRRLTVVPPLLQTDGSLRQRRRRALAVSSISCARRFFSVVTKHKVEVEGGNARRRLAS